MRFLFSTFLIVYLGVSFLVIFHMMDVLKPFKVKYIVLVLYIVLSLAMLLGRALSSLIPLELGAMTVRLGYAWISLLTFTSVWSLTFIILRLCKIGPIAEKSRMILFIGEIFICSLILIVGYINAYNVKIVKHQIQCNKGVNLKIVQISDVHLGYMNSEKQFSRIVDMINLLNPDILFITGDFLENENSYAERKNIGKSIERVNAKLGVWAVTGNHEYISGIDKSMKYMKSLGINVISDSCVTIGNDLLVIGQEDPAKTWRTQKAPLPLDQILSQKFENEKDINDLINERVTIVLTHQVKDHAIYENKGIDLVLSGHTHDGQFFPWNLAVRKIYDISYGLVKRGDSYFYVSSGAGIWGPAMRLGTISEIVMLEIR